MKRILEDRPLTDAERHARYVAKPGVVAKRSAAVASWYARNPEKLAAKRAKEAARKKELRSSAETRAEFLQKERAMKHAYSETLNGRARGLLRSARGRTVRFGLPPMTLTLEDVIALLAAGACPYTGVPFSFERPTKGLRKNPWSPSLDQKNPREGYTRENTEAVSTWWNLAKNEWPADVMRTALSGIRSKENPGAQPGV